MEKHEFIRKLGYVIYDFLQVEEGVELILQESIRVNKDLDDKNTGIIVSVDTIVQEKNITYPWRRSKRSFLHTEAIEE